MIEEPITVDPSLDRRSYLSEAVDEYAWRLEEAVRRHPESWGGWKMIADPAEVNPPPPSL